MVPVVLYHASTANYTANVVLNMKSYRIMKTIKIILVAVALMAIYTISVIILFIIFLFAGKIHYIHEPS